MVYPHLHFQRKLWILIICCLCFENFSTAIETCGVCDNSCDSACYCQREISYDIDEYWDRWQGRYVQNRGGIRDIIVKCFGFINPDIFMNDQTCREGQCRSITFLDSNISTLTINFFKRTPFFGAIYLNNSGIQNLQVGAFTGLSNLKTLQLEDNNLKNIKTGCLHTLSVLETLDLHNNAIETIDEEAFLGLLALEDLDLSNNRLKVIPKDLLKPLENLKNLILSNNLLSSVDFNVDDLKNLQSVYLNHNAIETIITCFKDTDLASLFLQDNRISHINDSCFPSNTSYLNMANNNISDLTFLKSLHSLTRLDMSNNKLQELPIHTFEDSENLLTLDLSHNEIRKLKFGIFSTPKNIQYLNLSDTKLEDLDSQVLIPLNELLSLDISDNNMNYWDSDSFVHLDNLEKFFVQGNNFTCKVITSLFLQSRLRNVSLIYNTDFSIENIKGFPCSPVEQQQNSAKNMTDNLFSWDELRNYMKNVTDLLVKDLKKISVAEESTTKNFGEDIQRKIDASLKPALKEIPKNIEDSLKSIFQEDVSAKIEASLKSVLKEEIPKEMEDSLIPVLEKDISKKIEAKLKSVLEEEILKKIEDSLKSVLGEERVIIESQFVNIQTILHDILYRKVTNTSTHMNLMSFDVTATQVSSLNSSILSIDEKINYSFHHLKLLILFGFSIFICIFIVVILISLFSSSKKNRGFDLGQELPIISS